MDDLKPPDHLDAVKLEQDGHLNKDYLKEIFLGNHEELAKGSLEDQEKKLADIFNKYVILWCLSSMANTTLFLQYIFI